MIKTIKKIKKKIFLKNIYFFLIKLGRQKKSFLNNKYILKNCLISTWIKILKKNKKIFLFGYSNSLIISGIIKIISKIFNKKKLTNIKIILKYDILNLINIKNFFVNIKKNNFFNIFKYLKTKLIYN